MTGVEVTHTPVLMTKVIYFYQTGSLGYTHCHFANLRVLEFDLYARISIAHRSGGIKRVTIL
jgi:hypothetical protein